MGDTISPVGRGLRRRARCLQRHAQPQASPQPAFDFRADFCHSVPLETHALDLMFRANAPVGQKRFPIGRPTIEVATASICITAETKSRTGDSRSPADSKQWELQFVEWAEKMKSRLSMPRTTICNIARNY